MGFYPMGKNVICSGSRLKSIILSLSEHITSYIYVITHWVSWTKHEHGRCADERSMKQCSSSAFEDFYWRFLLKTVVTCHSTETIILLNCRTWSIEEHLNVHDLICDHNMLICWYISFNLYFFFHGNYFLKVCSVFQEYFYKMHSYEM